jgi:hypothetical protein
MSHCEFGGRSQQNQQLELVGGCNAMKSRDLELWGHVRSPPPLPTIFQIGRNLAKMRGGKRGQITPMIRFLREVPAARVTTGLERRGMTRQIRQRAAASALETMIASQVIFADHVSNTVFCVSSISRWCAHYGYIWLHHLFPAGPAAYNPPLNMVVARILKISYARMIDGNRPLQC